MLLCKKVLVTRKKNRRLTLESNIREDSWRPHSLSTLSGSVLFDMLGTSGRTYNLSRFLNLHIVRAVRSVLSALEPP
jgi:hypothetical protein